jgi:D-3-phosphoglycerate dehydrogenase
VLVKAFDSGKVLFAGLMFLKTNQHQKWLFWWIQNLINPHIGAATGEAQDRIGTSFTNY